MERKTWFVLLGIGAAVLIVGGVFAYPLFAPQKSTQVNQELPEEMKSELTAVKTGQWEGDAGHRVSGTVTLYEGPDGHFLRFEDYKQTPGPDVFLYLSTSADEPYDGEAMKVLIPGGKDGQSTLEGAFNVPLPDGFDPAKWKSAYVWCDRFSVPFGHATFVDDAMMEK